MPFMSTALAPYPTEDDFDDLEDTNTPYERVRDPARLGYPPTFPVELALRTASTEDICAAYGVSQAEWRLLRQDPRFLADLRAAVEVVKREGMSFKLKAQLQAEELLKTSWRMIHSDAPAGVRADLIKFTIRAAGLDASAATALPGGGTPNTLQIQINLG